MEQKEKLMAGLIDVLVEDGHFSTKEAVSLIENFKNSSKETFDDFLLSEGLIARRDLLESLGKNYGVPAFDVVGYLFDHDLIANFSKDVLLRNCFIPLEVDQNMLAVVASEPDDDLCELIGSYVPYVIELRVGLQRDIRNAIREFYDTSYTNIDDLLDEDETDIFNEECEEDRDDVECLIDTAQDVAKFEDEE